ncbi:hypothetical protein LVX13_38610 [Streptomyces albulus]|uniref:hypothetical protein n=1 Tax=Streptomyces noursei TaxID=1971 RepID=UPI001F1E9136|nr:hypothetical protein [Streptomyces noursei]MCE4948960.1 hypothetical protein [Streptomyces noursei]
MDEKTEADTKQKEKRIDLSLAQVSGSALAAAVAAFLAGQLGVYGTIIGAAVVSIVATTGGTIFQHLFRRTGEQIKEAAVTTRPKPRRDSTTRSQTTTNHTGPAGPTMVLPTFDKHGTEDPVTSVRARDPGPATARTQLIPRAQQPPGPDAEATRLMARPAEQTMALGRAAQRDTAPDATAVLPEVGAPGAPVPGSMPPGTEEATATYGTRLRGWKRPALGALAVFVLAMGAVTATELLVGESASGNGGTTIGNLTTGNVAPHRPSTPQTPDPGRSTGNGTGHDGGTPSPDPSRSGGSGTGGTDSGTGHQGENPTPTPSDGATGSPSPGTSSSPDASPSPSTGTDGGKGDGSGSTGGGATPGHQQSEQNPGGRQSPDPNAP